MPLFRRPAPVDDAVDHAGDHPVGAVEAPVKAGGKGRPTPKRSEAAPKRRMPVTAPTTRREAYRRRRQRIKADRRSMRTALVTGDEKKLPPRDAGPVKRYVRDLVDCRRNVAGLFLPSAIVILLLSTIHSKRAQSVVQLVFLAVLVGIALDTWQLTRSIRRRVQEHFGADAARGISTYAVMRALQIRRLRMPPPKVKPGDVPVPGSR